MRIINLSTTYLCFAIATQLCSDQCVDSGLDYQAGRKPMEINVFRDLRRLDFSVFSMERTDLLLLTPLLQSCPVLQEFHLHVSIYCEQVYLKNLPKFYIYDFFW